MERKQVISLSNQNFTYSNEFLANSTGNTCDRDLRAAWVIAAFTGISVERGRRGI